MKNATSLNITILMNQEKLKSLGLERVSIRQRMAKYIHRVRDVSYVRSFTLSLLQVQYLHRCLPAVQTQRYIHKSMNLLHLHTVQSQPQNSCAWCCWCIHQYLCKINNNTQSLTLNWLKLQPQHYKINAFSHLMSQTCHRE